MIMKYIKNVQIYNESLFINENKVEIVQSEQLSSWKKPKYEVVKQIEKTLQGYNKVEFTDWDGKPQIVSVEKFLAEVVDDTEGEGYRMDYLIMDSEGNYYHIDNYKPIYGL